jgi:hypothetical protein
MDSGERGKEYEEIVDRLLHMALRRDNTASDADDLIIHGRKHYLGKSGHSHEIDISFEATVAGVAVLVLVECKCYKRQVGTEDVLEFSARLEDIGANKGILVSNSGFAIGARRIASARGIALIRATSGKWLVVMRLTGIPAPHRNYDWGYSDAMTLGWNAEQLVLTLDAINDVDLVAIGDEKVPSSLNHLLDQYSAISGQRQFGGRYAIIFSIEADGGAGLRARIGGVDEELIHAERALPLQRDSDSPDKVLVFVDSSAVRQATAYIESCMHCDALGADVAFDTVLGWITQSSPDVTEYLLETPAKCPYCRREMQAKTLTNPK